MFHTVFLFHSFFSLVRLTCWTNSNDSPSSWKCSWRRKWNFCGCGLWNCWTVLWSFVWNKMAWIYILCRYFIHRIFKIILLVLKFIQIDYIKCSLELDMLFRSTSNNTEHTILFWGIYSTGSMKNKNKKERFEF